MMKGWEEGTPIAEPHHSMLPRSIGVSIAALGALLCWAAVIGLIQAIN